MGYTPMMPHLAIFILLMGAPSIFANGIVSFNMVFSDAKQIIFFVNAPGKAKASDYHLSVNTDLKSDNARLVLYGPKSVDSEDNILELSFLLEDYYIKPYSDVRYDGVQDFFYVALNKNEIIFEVPAYKPFKESDYRVDIARDKNTGFRYITLLKIINNKQATGKINYLHFPLSSLGLKKSDIIRINPEDHPHTIDGDRIYTKLNTRLTCRAAERHLTLWLRSDLSRGTLFDFDIFANGSLLDIEIANVLIQAIDARTSRVSYRHINPENVGGHTTYNFDLPRKFYLDDFLATMHLEVASSPAVDLSVKASSKASLLKHPAKKSDQDATIMKCFYGL